MTNRCLRSLLAAACLLLGACRTMSPEECRTARWDEVGLRDGLAGATLPLLDERVKDCAREGVAVDTPHYLRGRDRGLQSYCQLDKAAGLGLDGRPYEGVCPAAVDAEFRRRHAVGHAVHAARAELDQMESRRRELERRLLDTHEDREWQRARQDHERRRAREDGRKDLGEEERRKAREEEDRRWAREEHERRRARDQEKRRMRDELAGMDRRFPLLRDRVYDAELQLQRLRASEARPGWPR